MARLLLSSSEVKEAPTLEERPTMKQLQEVMRIEDIDIITQWRDLGLELVDSNKILKVIEANHPSDVNTCCRLMFEKWLEKTPDASWSQLIIALSNIDMNTAADAVSKLFKSETESIEYEVFVKFYSELTIVFCDKNYIPHFVPTKIISPSDVHHMSNMPDNDRSVCLLKNISDPLECGESQNFYQMLEVMEAHGNLQVQQLVENIKAFLKGVDPAVISKGPTSTHTDAASTSDATSANVTDFSDCSNILTAFVLLTEKISKLLKKADFCTLRRAILLHKNVPKGVQFPDDLYKKIQAAQDLDALLDLLVGSKHSSWADLRLLDALITSSGIREAKVLVSKYKEIIFSKKLGEVLVFMPEERKHKDAYTSKVGSKIEKNANEITVGDLSRFVTTLETIIMDINNGSCVLEHLGTGCLEIHWLIPTHCRFHAYKSALNNRHKFCDIHLQYLHIEPYPPIYDPFTIQPTMLSNLLRLPKPIASRPAEVIDHYYCFLSNNLDNSVMCQIMLELKLLNEKDLVQCAKMYSDYQKNAFLLDQLLVTDTASIVGFCHMLQNGKNQELGHMLMNSIESIPADDVDAVTDMRSCVMPSQSASSKEDDPDISPVYHPEVFLAAKTVHIRFLNLLAQLKQKLKDKDPKHFLTACNKLTANASHLKTIPLIASDYLEDLDDAGIEEIFNRLAFLWRWNDHSILRALLEACSCQDSIKMLDDFESQIDATQPMELFPIYPPSMKTAPSFSSAFTVLSIRGEYDQDEPVPLQYVHDVAAIMMDKFGILPHALQLLAARSNPLMLYWMIPKSIVPLISEGVNEHLDFLKEQGFSEVAIYPNTILFATDNFSHGSFALLSIQPQSAGVAEEVAFLEGTSDDTEINQVYQQNSNLKAEVAKLKSSEKTLLNKLEKSKEKYDRLSQCFENSCSKAEQIMDQLEETKSYFEILPFLKKFIKDDMDKESIALSEDHDESISDIAERPPAFLNRMQIFKEEFEKIKNWCESLEDNLPAADVKIKQLQSTVDELQLEHKGKSRETDELKEKSLNKEDSGIISPSVHDSTANQEEQEGPRETGSSQSSESDPLGSQKEKDSKVPKPQKSDHEMLMTMQTESSLDCPICTNRFTVDGPLQPRILKCGHTFCTNCIQQTSKMKNFIKCSFCYGVTPKGTMGIYELTVNRTLVDILSNMNLQRRETTPVDLCCMPNCNHPAEKICFECDPKGCKLCVVCCIAEHNRQFPPVKMHKLLNIDEVNTSFCDKHKQLLTHYSEKAAILACKECLAELGDEDFLPIEVAIQTLRQRLPKMMKDLESYLRRLQDAQYRMETIQGELGVTKSKTMQEIMKKFNNYQFIFQERENTLIANLEMEVNNRKTCLKLQINKLRNITEKVTNYKELLQEFMQKDKQEFLFKYRDTQNEINELLDNEDFGLQQPVALPDISVYLPDKFESDLCTLGSVGGGPVIDFNAAMHTSGLLQLTWSMPNGSDDVEECEIEYSTWRPLFADVTSVKCDSKILNYIVHPICPGYTYQFRIRSRSASGWGMWSESILGQFDDFPRTIGYSAKIVTIKISSTAYYRITAKGAKAADGADFIGGRGAIISATFLLQRDDVLEILCGGMSECHNSHSGGAGGTFVAVNNRQLFDNLLLVAGGGGGTRGRVNEDCDGCDASLEPNGTSATMTDCAEGGINGAPGKDANFKGPSWGHGGAGWQKSSSTAKSFVKGGNGGECGGFGGGGGVGIYGGGGGGGFSGGGGGRGGGGGGSYVRADGDNVTKEVGNMSHGEVEVVKLAMAC